MNLRTIPSIILFAAVVTASGLGLNNGMSLRIDHHGHLAVDAPVLTHILVHGDGADHLPSDYDHDADHRDLHHQIAATADSQGTTKTNAAASSHDLTSQHPSNLDLCSTAAVPPAAIVGHFAVSHAADHHGGTARTEVASLRSIVLLV